MDFKAAKFLPTFFVLLASLQLYAGGSAYSFFKNSNYKTALVENSKSDIDIVLPAKISSEEIEAAFFLRKNLEEISDRAKVTISFDYAPREKAKTKIFLATTLQKKEISPASADFSGANEFFIQVRRDKIFLNYPSVSSAYGAAAQFLRSFCGVDFFAPAELGRNAEKKDFIKIPQGDFFVKPSFIASRIQLGGVQKYAKEQSEWSKIHSVEGGEYLNFSHNLNKIFHQDLIKVNREYFSEISRPNGKLAYDANAQPNFVNAATVDFAIESVLAAFDSNPKMNMYSLGIKDTQLVDGRKQTLDFKRGYFRGFPNWTDLIFDFTNKVAKRVGEKYPNKFIGCLAYLICEDSPNFDLEKNIVPFLTTDRANYFDKNFKEQDFLLLEKWNKRTGNLKGVYDYFYGSPYIFPREMGDYVYQGLKKAASENFNLYFAESYPKWGYDAKKLWVLTRLLSDVSQKPEELENEFYKNYYGVAAENMREFFDVAKRAWVGRKGGTRWLAMLWAESELELFSQADVEQMRSAIESAKKVSAFSDEKIRQRVQEVFLEFKLSSKLYSAYALKKKLFNAANSSAGEAELLSLSTALRDEINAAKKSFERLKSESLLPMRGNCFHLDNDLTSPFELAALKILEKNANADSSKFPYPEMLKTAAKSNGNFQLDFAENFEFADSKTNLPSSWEVYALDYEGAFMRIASRVAHSGKNSLEIGKAEISGIGKTFPIRENQTAFISGYFKGRLTAGAACYASLRFIDKNNKTLARKTFIFPAGEWNNFQKFAIFKSAPKGSAKVNFSVFATRMKDGEIIFLDDIRLQISKQ